MVESENVEIWSLTSSFSRMLEKDETFYWLKAYFWFIGIRFYTGFMYRLQLKGTLWKKKSLILSRRRLDIYRRFLSGLKYEQTHPQMNWMILILVKLWDLLRLNHAFMFWFFHSAAAACSLGHWFTQWPNTLQEMKGTEVVMLALTHFFWPNVSPDPFKWSFGVLWEINPLKLHILWDYCSLKWATFKNYKLRFHKGSVWQKTRMFQWRLMSSLFLSEQQNLLFFFCQRFTQQQQKNPLNVFLKQGIVTSRLCGIWLFSPVALRFL